MLALLIPLALILGGTVLFLLITGANAYREMERRQARFRELSEAAFGDLVELPAAAKMHGEGAHKRRSDRLTRNVRTHSDGATNR